MTNVHKKIIGLIGISLLSLGIVGCGATSASSAASTGGSAGSGSHSHKGGGKGLTNVVVTQISGSTVTVETPNGKTKAVAISGQTRITENGTKASVSAIKPGEHITVHGKPNSHGPVAATAITITP